MTKTTRLWGESFSRQKIFDIVLNGNLPKLYSDTAYYVKVTHYAGDTARWILEDQPEKMNDELLGLVETCFGWLDHRGYGAYAVKMVNDERLRQQEKWGVEQDNPNEKFLAILMEEIGEVCDDLERVRTSHMVDEITQVAAVACCWLEFRLTEDLVKVTA